MKAKKIISLLLTFLLLFPIMVQATKTDMYISGTHVVRDLEVINGFDMLPILDIANELGYSAQFNGTTAVLTGNRNSYTFTLHNPAVYDNNGIEYGLDIVPQMIDGKFMIPAKFLIDHLHLTYTWDDITNTIFINSNPTYKWLINTNEYKQERARRDLLGEWVFENTYYGDPKYISVTFSADGSCLYKTDKEKAFGTFRFTDPYHIAVDFDVYKRSKYEPTYYFSSCRTNYFEFSYNTLKETGYFTSAGETVSTGRTFYNYKTLLYRPDSTVVVNQRDIASYAASGWYQKPVCYVYALDGRKEMIYEEDFPAWKNAGWYGSTKIRIYKMDKAPMDVDIWSLKTWNSLEWTTSPVMIMFDQAGAKHKVPISQRHQLIAEGWYYPETLSLGKTYDQIRGYFGPLENVGTWEGSTVYESEDGFLFIIPRGHACIEVDLPVGQLFPELQLMYDFSLPLEDFEAYVGADAYINHNAKEYDNTLILYYQNKMIELPCDYDGRVYLYDWVNIYNY